MVDECRGYRDDEEASFDHQKESDDTQKHTDIDGGRIILYSHDVRIFGVRLWVLTVEIASGSSLFEKFLDLVDHTAQGEHHDSVARLYHRVA